MSPVHKREKVSPLLARRASVRSSASSRLVCADDDDDDDDGGAAWWPWALVFGGAGVVILWTALSDGDIQLGNGGTVISPVR